MIRKMSGRMDNCEWGVEDRERWRGLNLPVGDEFKEADRACDVTVELGEESGALRRDDEGEGMYGDSVEK